MKKTFGVLILALSVILPATSSLYAHEEKGMGMMGQGGGEGKGMMGGGMMGKMGMQKSVVATSDGGIVVVAGNKITKYDKDLNVVKEIETPMDMKMKEMMEKCSMMKGEEPSAASGHESHH